MFTPLVIMCSWHRTHNIDKILNALKNQSYKEFLFVIWNNDFSMRDILNKSIERYHNILNIRIFHSPENKFGYGRFLAVRALPGNPVIFFDDDQIPKHDFVEYMIKMYEMYGDRCILSRWCRNIKEGNKYFQTPLLKPGNVANYTGTGGMVVDRKVFDHDSIINDFPEKYRNVEDIWLSHLAYKYHKLKGFCIEGKIIHLPDKIDQWLSLKKKKEECVKECFRCGMSEYVSGRNNK